MVLINIALIADAVCRKGANRGMTREEALAVLKTNYRCMTEEKNCPRTCEGCGLAMQPGELEEATRVAIKTLEPKTGHWIGIDEEPHEDYECDKCGYTISTFTANIKPHTEYKYCPHCGAKMESGV